MAYVSKYAINLISYLSQFDVTLFTQILMVLSSIARDFLRIDARL